MASSAGTAGFTDRITGVRTAPVNMSVAAASSKLEPERKSMRLTRQVRLTNRAEHGALKGKPWVGTYNGIAWPDGAERDRPDTWLQPGESMVVDYDIFLGLCGDVFDPSKRDALRIINTCGGWEYEPLPAAGLASRVAPMKVVGPPIGMPDLVIVHVDGRGKEVGDTVSLYDTYVGDRFASKASSKKN